VSAFGLGTGVGRKKVGALRVLFGDQLDTAYLKDADKDADVVLMMEVADEATHVASHKQRTALFFTAMRHFALELADRGWRVRYVALDDEDNTHSFDEEVERGVAELSPERVVCVRPGEWRVMEMVEGWKGSLSADVQVIEDEHFYLTPDEFGEWAEGRKQLIMETFYRWHRKRLGVLLDDDGDPVGGEWNFDKENRETFKKAPTTPRVYTPEPDDVTKEVFALVEERFPDAPGSLEGFRWAYTRDRALRALRDFIEHRLPRFGTYQDAMWTGEPFLNHSLLSTALNLKLLNPREVVAPAIEAYEAGDAPINSVEGFVRQLIGWREFIRGVYWLEGPGYGERNELEHEGALPELYWSGETDMACMRESVGQVLDHGYGHHIQRLMVTGNFALIAGVRPREVADWYLGMYVDGVDWVTTPNTIGMALHADAGVVGAKPYSASGKYIKRMSNYCDSCAYHVKQRSGEGACPFNVFYWDFLIRHRERFSSNRRMAMILKNVDRMKEDERVEITVSAKSLRKTLGIEG